MRTTYTNLIQQKAKFDRSLVQALTRLQTEIDKAHELLISIGEEITLDVRKQLETALGTVAAKARLETALGHVSASGAAAPVAVEARKLKSHLEVTA